MTRQCFTIEQVRQFKILLKLSEECNEVGQMCAKYIEFGDESYHPEDPTKTTNKELLARELGDVLAVLDHIIEKNLVDARTLQEQREKKYWILHKKFEE